MNEIKLPLRQKVLLGLTAIIGLSILILCRLKTIDPNVFNMIILCYFLGVPLSLLVLDTLIDLNDNKIFNIWLLIGLVFFCIYLTVRNINVIWIGSLRALLFFLIAYKIFNTIMKKTIGKYLINTYRQTSWIHDTAKRKITGLDVVFNILLSFIIILSVIVL